MARDDLTTDFGAFVRDHEARLRAIVTTMAGRRRVDVDDLVQEGLARAYEKRATFVSDEHAVNFVCHVVRCLLVDEHRSWYRRHVVASADVAGVTGEDPADLVVATDECHRVVRSMAALPAEQRQLLWDHVVEGDSYADIARRTATPLATVRSTAHRARLNVLHRVRDAGGHIAGIPALVRAAFWRWRPATTSAENAVGCAVAISLLFAGTAGTGSPPATAEVFVPSHRVTAAATVATTSVVRTASPPRATASVAAPPTTASTPPPKTLPLPDVMPAGVQFAGTYSRHCTFTPDDTTAPIGGTGFRFDCMVSGKADHCVITETGAVYDCEVVLGPTVDRGLMAAYGTPLVPGVACRVVSRTGHEVVTSLGEAQYTEPGSPTAHVPVHVVAKAVSPTSQYLGTLVVGGKKIGLKIDVPFTCDEDVDDAIGFSGSTYAGPP